MNARSCKPEIASSARFAAAVSSQPEKPRSAHLKPSAGAALMLSRFREVAGRQRSMASNGYALFVNLSLRQS